MEQERELVVGVQREELHAGSERIILERRRRLRRQCHAWNRRHSTAVGDQQKPVVDGEKMPNPTAGAAAAEEKRVLAGGDGDGSEDAASVGDEATGVQEEEERGVEGEAGGDQRGDAEDDKAGIAEIITAMVYLKEHPEIKHGKIRVGFNPDEEIGLGAHKFDVEKFGCEWAYTMDGGEVGELEFENFNAASAKVVVKGRNVHPGYAKNKMINSMCVANQFMNLLPDGETPQCTENYEGFYHLVGITGEVEQTTLSYIIRDHDRAKFEARKENMLKWAAEINKKYGEETVTVELKDQYYNMREKIEPVMHIIDIAFKAMEEAGVTPKVKAIRGGTDGAQLSFKGLPCPNIFAGGLNFHGRYEFAPIQSLEKAMMVVVKISELVAR